MKKLGIDFDNTIVIYDELFYKVASERNLIPINFSKNKIEIRNYLRKQNKENEFTNIQSEVYGKRIIDANPTDGLWDDNRTDEQQIGATYDEIEWAMNQKMIGKISRDFNGREKEIFDIFENHHNNNKHKMTKIPVCIIPPELK